MKIRKIAAALLTMALCLGLCLPAALAEGTTQQVASVENLTVNVRCTGSAGIPREELTVRLTPRDGAPMPEGRRSGVYACTVTGGGSAVLSLPAAQVGRHLYTLHQEAGGYVRGEYDSRVYHIAVTVTADGACTAAVYGDGAMAGDKYDAAVFRNVYRSRTKPEEPLRPSPKTADGGMAVYAALALASMAGIAAAVGQKDAF